MNIHDLNQVASLVSNYSCVVYVGAAAAAFIATWASHLRILMAEHQYRVLAIPIAVTVLVLGIGVIDILVRLGTIGVPQSIASSSVIPKPIITLASPTFTQRATPTPTNAAELVALREDNAKLKIENARLKKAKAPRIVRVLPTPHISTTPIPAPSKISASDCDALLGAQQLLDSASDIRNEAQKEAFGSDRHRAALDTESKAASNLASLRARLCVESAQ